MIVSEIAAMCKSTNPAVERCLNRSQIHHGGQDPQGAGEDKGLQEGSCQHQDRRCHARNGKHHSDFR